MSEQLTRELIDRLAEVLGTTAPYIWSVYVRQQALYAVVSVVGMTVGAVACVVSSVACWRWGNTNQARVQAEKRARGGK